MRAAVLVMCASCGSSTSMPADAPDRPIDASPDAPVPTITGQGTVREWMGPMMFGAAIPSATACVHGTTPPHCVTADAAGAFTLDQIPAGADAGLVFVKAGHVRTVTFHKTPVTSFSGFVMSMITDAIAQQKLADAGGTYPLAGTGIVEVGVYAGVNTPGAGATVTMSPASGTGPIYLGLDGYPDPSLTATSAEGGVMFVNVAPGMVTLTITLAGKSCVTAMDGWHGSAPHTVRIPAEADTLSYAPVLCE